MIELSGIDEILSVFCPGFNHTVVFRARSRIHGCPYVFMVVEDCDRTLNFIPIRETSNRD
jgi:hypothetical protein